MKRKAFLGFMWSMMLAFISAVGLSSFTEMNLGTASAVTTGVSVVASFVPQTTGILPAVFLKEAFIQELKEALEVIINCIVSPRC